LTPEILAACTGARIGHAELYADEITAAMREYAINTPVRQAAFLAQIGHESGGLRYSTELWGPTPAQKRYEGRKDLGNTQKGDGAKFRGHGLIQTTGRHNHARVRDRLRLRCEDVPDFEAVPLALALPRWAALSAADYWDDKGLNEFADLATLDSFETITRRINGGMNGWVDRLRLWDRAKDALGIDPSEFTPDHPSIAEVRREREAP
jgi:putative chitinase